MYTDCTYCGADITAHDPLVLEAGFGDDRSPAGQFCNYACLAVHIDEAGLTTGNACRIDCC
ncbi:MAG: hypothetical protein R3324_03920 [Halobacteriales archaeon]|nr:hypothetical protein [Halobacteriales archaeon]